MNYSIIMSSKKNDESCGCKLCEEIEKKETWILESKGFHILFNRYPYIIGNLMIVPDKAVSAIEDLDVEMRGNLMEVINQSQKLLKQVLNTDSCNIGMNLGKFSGASIPQHIHIHIVPRKSGDQGFMEVIARDPIAQMRNINNYESKIREYFRDNWQHLD